MIIFPHCCAYRILTYLLTGSLCIAGNVLLTAWAEAAETPQGAPGGESGTVQQLDLAVLLAAYPGVIVEVVAEDGRIFAVTRSGKRFVYDDGRTKSVDEALEAPDLEDMLAQPYPVGPLTGDPPAGQHPGRRRVTEFLAEVYGQDAAEVSAACRPVRFLDRTVPFNSRNGAADALERVAARLEDLVARDRGLRDVLYPVVGTFNWRTIAGTSRLSMHALGIAVDVNPGRNPYWRHHRRPSDKLARRQSFPGEVVAAFEAEGFIWGGKWAEYDIMHFEFRPELLIKARASRGDRSGLDEGTESDKNGHAAQ
ncbi:M15 family metallopeptidase [Desulfolutivibrio sp.]|uniref:M15 family metallopeptidase n=1 Tax=Desulfolutivibrio sp. TaxID=2773296 RepID=UPI002F96C5FD